MQIFFHRLENNLAGVLLTKKLFKMAEAYCVKCKAKREMKDSAEVVMKNQRRALKGTCPTCGTGMFKILGKA